MDERLVGKPTVAWRPQKWWSRWAQKTSSLGIQSPNLRMGMEPKYYAFRFGDWNFESSSENMTVDS